MLPEQTHNRITYILGFLLFYLLLFNVLGLMTFEPFREYGRITDHWTLYITFTILLYFFIQQRGLNQNYYLIYAGIFLVSFSYVLTHLYNQNFLHDTTLAYQLLSFAFILLVMKIKWTNNHIIIFGITALIITALFFMHWYMKDLPTSRYIGYFTNTNVAGVFFFSLLYFKVVAIKPSHIILKVLLIIGSLANVLLIYTTTSRSILLCLLVIFGAMAILRLSKRLFSLLVYFVLAFNLLFVLVYSWLSTSQYREALDKWSLGNFKKSFFSGREEIWEPTLQHAAESPFIGHFVGIAPADFMENTHYVHTHNQFIQVFLETGVVGLVCFLIFLFFIWKTYLIRLDSHVVQWSSCFFLGLLIYQNTGMTFFQNLPSIGLLHWLIISIGVSYALNKR